MDATQEEPSVSLKNKTVVITGAGSGVGLATAQQCSNGGAEVHALDLNTDQLDAIAVRSQSLDVSNSDAWKNFAATVDDIDHIHLNAGIQSAPPEAPLSEYRFGSLQIDRYKKMMGVNVDGVVLGLHYLLPKMKDGGSVVVTCSLAGITPYDVDPLYSMSKHAVTGLVRSLKKELGERDIRINALCPGGIDTAIIPHDQRSASPTGEFMTPDDIAQEILRLFATPESGETWAKVSSAKPAWIIHAPGKKPKPTK